MITMPPPPPPSPAVVRCCISSCTSATTHNQMGISPVLQDPNTCTSCMKDPSTPGHRSALPRSATTTTALLSAPKSYVHHHHHLHRCGLFVTCLAAYRANPVRFTLYAPCYSRIIMSTSSVALCCKINYGHLDRFEQYQWREKRSCLLRYHPRLVRAIHRLMSRSHYGNWGIPIAIVLELEA